MLHQNSLISVSDLVLYGEGQRFEFICSYFFLNFNIVLIEIWHICLLVEIIPFPCFINNALYYTTTIMLIIKVSYAMWITLKRDWLSQMQHGIYIIKFHMLQLSLWLEFKDILKKAKSVFLVWKWTKFWETISFALAMCQLELNITFRTFREKILF